MSLSHAAAEYMLSDALLPENGGSRAERLRLELPSDRLLKFVTVGLPLLLVSLAFAREFSAGSQISCFSPSNLTAQQSGYVDAACWDSLLHHGRGGTKSLWALKVFPYSLLALAGLMFLPALLWRSAAAPRAPLRPALRRRRAGQVLQPLRAPGAAHAQGPAGQRRARALLGGIREGSAGEVFRVPAAGALPDLQAARALLGFHLHPAQRPPALPFGGRLPLPHLPPPHRCLPARIQLLGDNRGAPNSPAHPLQAAFLLDLPAPQHCARRRLRCAGPRRRVQRAAALPLGQGAPCRLRDAPGLRHPQPQDARLPPQ
ncbi:hypothetical protein Q9966_014590 [Columba livia]|nr:hypothetical protein Q9966_014590 [Columba livia]